MNGRIQAIVIEQERIGEDIFALRLGSVPESDITENSGNAQETDIFRTDVIRPGQFFNLYLDDGAHLLPRPISVCDVKDGELLLVYRQVGYGTAVFSKLREGESLWLLGPLGNGFPIDTLDNKATVMTVGGGLGIPPMLYLTKTLAESGFAVESVLGYRDEAFLKEEFDAIGVPVHYSSDSGRVGKQGTVIDCMEQEGLSADVLLACGPKPMLAALKEYAGERGKKLYVSLEERMACGVGACLACVCETAEVDGHSRVHNRRICKDGPVFDAREVVL